MHIILTGATGLVGTSALSHILSLSAGPISKVSILSRKPVPLAEGKPNVTVIQHDNFLEYPNDLLKRLRGAEACIWAMGVSVTAVSREECVKITVDYPIAAAKAFATLSDNFRFVYVSGESASTNPGFLTPTYGRIKGQAEAALLDLAHSTPSLKPYSVRPGYVDASLAPEVRKAMPSRPLSWPKRLEPVLAPAYRTLYPSGCTPARELARFLVELAVGDGEPLKGEGVEGEGRIVGNKVIRRSMKREVMGKVGGRSDEL